MRIYSNGAKKIIIIPNIKSDVLSIQIALSRSLLVLLFKNKPNKKKDRKIKTEQITTKNKNQVKVTYEFGKMVRHLHATVPVPCSSEVFPVAPK